MNFFPWMDGRWIEYEVNIIYDIFLEIEKILKIGGRSGVSRGRDDWKRWYMVSFKKVSEGLSEHVAL